MPFLIDTSIFIHARDGAPAVLAKLHRNAGAVFISALTLAELQRGLNSGSPVSALRRQRHDVLARSIPVRPFDVEAAEAYGRIVAQIGRIKQRDFDHLIAAHAIATRSVLVTDNTRDFANVPGLVLENWLKP